MKPLTNHEQTLLDAALEITKLEFAEEGQMHPLLLALRDDGQLGVAPMTGLTKSAVSQLVNQTKQLAPCVLIVEAWLSHVTQEKSPAIFNAAKDGDTSLIMPPRVDPARKEVVMLQFFHHDRHIMMRAEIIRPKEGKPTLGAWGDRIDNADTSEGAGTCRSMSFENPENARLTSGDV